jgi:hypothetical protein
VEGAVLLCLVACFGGVPKTGKVVGYQPGRVLTKLGHYQVGELSPEWRRLSLDKAVIAFYNQSLSSTIATDAFCQRAYDDSPLDMLTRHLFAGLQDVKILEEKPFMLDSRGALQTSFQATLDGVPVRIDSVVVKKDWCLFDFYLVSPPESYTQALPHFETFYRGFVYSGEI